MNARFQELSSYYVEQAHSLRSALGTVSSVRIDNSLPEPMVTVIGTRCSGLQPIIQVDFTAGEIREYEIHDDRSMLLAVKRPQSLLEWKELVNGSFSYHFGYLGER